jgi:hypothetical protein
MRARSTRPRRIAVSAWALGLALSVGCKEAPAPVAPAQQPASATASAKQPASAPASQAAASQAAPAAKVAKAIQKVRFRAPAITRALPVAHTVAVVGVEGLDWVFRFVAKAQRELVPHFSARMRKDMPPAVGAPGALTEALGFAPNTPSGWQNVGVQPAAGVAMIFDDRLWSETGPVPLVMAQITDRGVLLNWLSQLDARFGEGLKVKLTGEKTGACEHLQWGTHLACMANRRGFVMLMPLPDSAAERHEALKVAFTAVAKDAGPALADAPQFQRTLAGYAGSPGAYLYVDHHHLATATQKNGAASKPELAFFLDRFPATGIRIGPKGQQLRVLADAAGAKALRQILVPKGPGPKLDRLWVARGVAVQQTLNLAEIFDGISALVPPSRNDIGGQVLIFKNMVPSVLGVPLGELTGTLTGHAAIIGALPDMQQPPNAESNLVLAVGTRSAEAAEALVVKLLKRLASKDAKFTYTRTAQHGRPTFSLEAGVLAIDGTLVLLGKAAAVEAALTAEAVPAPTALAAPGFLISSVDVGGMLQAFQGASPEEIALLRHTLRLLLKGEQTLAMQLMVDEYGIVSGDGPMTVALLGVVLKQFVGIERLAYLGNVAVHAAPQKIEIKAKTPQ